MDIFIAGCNLCQFLGLSGDYYSASGGFGCPVFKDAENALYFVFGIL
jgi:hypothetical protein